MKNKILVILFTISLGLSFSLMFTNQAEATIYSWPPTVTGSYPANNSWGIPTTFTWLYNVTFPTANSSWAFSVYFNEGLVDIYNASYMFYQTFVGNQTISMPWATTGFNAGNPLTPTQVYTMYVAIQGTPNSTRYQYVFHATNTSGTLAIPPQLTEIVTIGSTSKDTSSGAPYAYALSSIPTGGPYWPRFVESAYHDVLDGSVSQVQLAIYWQGTNPLPPTYDDSDLGDFTAWLSTSVGGQQSIGNPTHIDWAAYPFDTVGNQIQYFGTMTWENINLSVNNKAAQVKYIAFELKSNNHDLVVRMGLNNQDLNHDNLFDCFISSRTTHTPNGYKDHQGWASPTWVGEFPNGNNRDLGWSFVIHQNATSGAINNIGENVLEATGNKQYQPIYIQYCVDDLTVAKQINVTVGGVEKTDQGAPFPIELPQGTYVYVPQTAGNYVFKMRNSTYATLFTSKTIVIVSNTEDSWIEAVPAMGSSVTPVSLTYKYFPTKYGQIGVFDHSADTSDLSLAIDTIGNISSTAIKTITYTPPAISYPEGRVYYRLFCTNLTTPQGLGTPAVFEIYSVGQTGLTVLYNPLTIGPEGGTQTFQYAHNYVGAKVGIFSGASLSKLFLIKEVGEKKSGTFDFNYNSAEDRYVAEQVYMNGHWIMITNRSINISYVAGYTPPIDPTTNWLDVSGMLGPMWSSLLGLIIVIVCILIPTIIDIYAQLELQVPAVVYVLLGSVGVAIAIILGLWPFWVTFFLLTTAVLYLVINYLVGHGVSVPGVSQVRNISARISKGGKK